MRYISYIKYIKRTLRKSIITCFSFGRPHTSTIYAFLDRNQGPIKEGYMKYHSENKGLSTEKTSEMLC
jgi:hypothetical protein